MGNDGKLFLILMRDDETVRKYQFRSKWFKLFLYVQALPLIAALLGLSGGLFLRHRHFEEANTHVALLKQAHDLHWHFERIQYVKEILTNAEHEFHGLFSTLSHSPAPSPNPGGQPVNLGRLFANVDSGLLSIRNMRVQNLGDKLRLRFEVHNLSDNLFTGTMTVYLVGTDASVVLAQGDEGELRFAIQDFHEVNALIGLPFGTSLEACLALRLIITDTDKEDALRQTIILSNIMDAQS